MKPTRLPLMHSLLLSLGALPPLPEPTREPAAEQDPTDVVGRITVGDEVILVRAGESAEQVQGKIDDVLCAWPVTTWPKTIHCQQIDQPAERVDEAVPPPRPRRADPDRKAKRKAQAKARRKGRS